MIQKSMLGKTLRFKPAMPQCFAKVSTLVAQQVQKQHLVCGAFINCKPPANCLNVFASICFEFPMFLNAKAPQITIRFSPAVYHQHIFSLLEYAWVISNQTLNVNISKLFDKQFTLASHIFPTIMSLGNTTWGSHLQLMKQPFNAFYITMFAAEIASFPATNLGKL